MPEDNGNNEYVNDDSTLDYETIAPVRERLFGETPRLRPVTDAGQPRPPRGLLGRIAAEERGRIAAEEREHTRLTTPPADTGQPRPPRLDSIVSERILAALAERPLRPLPSENMPEWAGVFVDADTWIPSLVPHTPPTAPKRKRASRPYTRKQIKQIAQVIRASLVPVSFNEDFIRVQYNVFMRVVQRFADYLCQQNHRVQFEQLCGMPTMNKMWERAHHAPSALTRERPLP